MGVPFPAMESSSKLLASVAGVSIAGAVVIGAVLAASGGSNGSPAQRPAGNEIGGTASAPASLTPTVVAQLSSSTVRTTAAVAKPKRQAVVNPGGPVTDPTTPVPDPTPVTIAPEGESTLIDQGPGTTDESGIRRAPAPTGSHPAPPPKRIPSQDEPTPTDSPS